MIVAQAKFYSRFRNFSPGITNDIWAFLFLMEFYKLIKDM